MTQASAPVLSSPPRSVPVFVRVTNPLGRMHEGVSSYSQASGRVAVCLMVPVLVIVVHSIIAYFVWLR